MICILLEMSDLRYWKILEYMKYFSVYMYRELLYHKCSAVTKTYYHLKCCSHICGLIDGSAQGE